MKKSIEELNNDVTKLSDKMSRMENLDADTLAQDPEFQAAITDLMSRSEEELMTLIGIAHDEADESWPEFNEDMKSLLFPNKDDK